MPPDRMVKNWSRIPPARIISDTKDMIGPEEVSVCSSCTGLGKGYA